MDFEQWWAERQGERKVQRAGNGDVEAAWNAALDEAMRIVFENGRNPVLIELIRTAKTS